MQTRSKVVEIDGGKFMLRKLPPAEGSFIFMRMMGLSMRMAAARQQSAQQQELLTEPKEPAKPSGEEQVRALTFMIFSGEIAFEDFKMIQNSCMQCVSILQVREGVEFPLPLMAADSTWTSEGAELEVGAVLRLTTEVLLFCFADFFDKGGRL